MYFRILKLKAADLFHNMLRNRFFYFRYNQGTVIYMMLFLSSYTHGVKEIYRMSLKQSTKFFSRLQGHFRSIKPNLSIKKSYSFPNVAFQSSFSSKPFELQYTNLVPPKAIERCQLVYKPYTWYLYCCTYSLNFLM